MILKQDMDIFGPEWTISRFSSVLSGDNLQMEANPGSFEALKIQSRENKVNI